MYNYSRLNENSQPATCNRQATVVCSEPNLRHRCLCGRCHVVTGAWLVLIIYAVGSLTSLFTHPVAFIIPLVIVICTAVAMRKEDKCLLMPLMIHLIISVVVLIILALWILVVAFVAIDRLNELYKSYLQYGSHNQDFTTIKKAESIMTWMIVGAEIFLLIVIAIQIWFVRIISHCMDYFREKQITMGIVVLQAAPQQNVLPYWNGDQPPPYVAPSCPTAP